MFIYQPHAHGHEITTTPDLVIDTAWLVGDRVLRASAAALSTTVACQLSEGESIVPAWVLVAAHYSPLVGVGIVLPSLRVIGRETWRLDDVADHFAALRLRLQVRAANGEMTVSESTRLPGPDQLTARISGAQGAIPRGAVILACAEPLAASTREARSVEVELSDPVLERSIRHKVQLF